MTKPAKKPNNPKFSSGPCTKNPEWSLDNLSSALLGRSHRSGEGKARLKEVIDLHREILGIPDDYRIAIVPASDTGAVEMCLWSMLGARGVDVLAWESFSSDWAKDVVSHLKLENARIMEADYGQIPDLGAVNWDNDVVFPWNGTTSGVRIPNHDWIADDRKGLTICDATSAIFAYEMEWSKLDVTTWSWQKVLGSEAAHGMLVLSPRAVERLESFTPDRPLPKIFRMTKGGKINEALFEGATINTPSMLATEDCLLALNWIKKIGGVTASVKRSRDNLEAVTKWVESSDWVDFLVQDKSLRSSTSLCLKIKDKAFNELPDDEQAALVKKMVKRLDAEDAAKDIGAYRDAPTGFRVWGGSTVETADIEAMLPWLDWAYAEIMKERAVKAA